MSNGDEQIDVSELEEFFRPAARLLTDFTHHHNLKLTKYYHNSATWELTFRHPHGGVGKIEVRKAGLGITLSCCWWLDKYELATRFLRNYEEPCMVIDPDTLGSKLEECLRTVLSWKPGNWNEIHDGHDGWRSNWTRDEFEALSDEFPIPRP